MGKAKKYKSDVFASLHGIGESLYRVGLIDDEKMREYDRDCLVESEEPVQLHSVRKQDSSRSHSHSPARLRVAQ